MQIKPKKKNRKYVPKIFKEKTPLIKRPVGREGAIDVMVSLEIANKLRELFISDKAECFLQKYPTKKFKVVDETNVFNGDCDVISSFTLKEVV